MLKPDPNFESNMDGEIKKFKNNADNNVERIQRSLRCCGSRSVTDYRSKIEDIYKVPQSCCRSNKLNEKGQCADDSVTWSGCLSTYISHVVWFRSLCRYTLFFMLLVKGLLVSQ